jgi:hypothetical protein
MLNKGESMRNAILFLFLVACTSRDNAPCVVASLAYCDANFACDGSAAEHDSCVVSAASWCSSPQSPQVDEDVADSCADAWWNSTCSVAPSGNTIEVTPAMLSCLEPIWPCGAEGGTSEECKKR